MTSSHKLTKTLVALVASVFLLLLVSQRQHSVPTPIQTLEGKSMGTTWQVQLATTVSAQGLQTLGAELSTVLKHLDSDVFSTYAVSSELSLLNRTPPNQELPVSRELLEVLLWARTINKQSYGAFDVTVGPLVSLWGFGPAESQQRVPLEKDIAAAKARLGSDQYVVNVRDGTAARTADIAIDLSAIAKGYAVDKVAELLLARGFIHFLVELGGEVRVQGWREPEQGWQVAIETPVAQLHQAYAAIDNRGQGLALAGSGDYRNFFEQDGKRYSHEIDPRTGYPIQHQLAGVTVLAETTAEADAWATALMVLGPEDGFYLAEQRDIAAYFIIRQDAGWQSRHTSAMTAYLLTKELTGKDSLHGQTQF